MFLVMAGSCEDYESENVWPVALYYDETAAHLLTAEANNLLERMLECNDDEDYAEMLKALIALDATWKDHENKPRYRHYSCIFWVEEVAVRDGEGEGDD